MMKNEKDMNIELGTKIIGNYGAMIPLSFGEVISTQTYETGPSTAEVKVKWENGSYTWVLATEINSGPSVNGSPIGIYTEEEYYNS